MKKSPYIDDEEIYLDIDTLVKIRYTLGCFRLVFQKLFGGNDDEVSKITRKDLQREGGHNEKTKAE